jgi:hypothetical protein
VYARDRKPPSEFEPQKPDVTDQHNGEPAMASHADLVQPVKSYRPRTGKPELLPVTSRLNADESARARCMLSSLLPA